MRPPRTSRRTCPRHPTKLRGSEGPRRWPWPTSGAGPGAAEGGGVVFEFRAREGAAADGGALGVGRRCPSRGSLLKNVLLRGPRRRQRPRVVGPARGRRRARARGGLLLLPLKRDSSHPLVRFAAFDDANRRLADGRADSATRRGALADERAPTRDALVRGSPGAAPPSCVSYVARGPAAPPSSPLMVRRDDVRQGDLPDVVPAVLAAPPSSRCPG